ncbi:MAG: lysylphosphatidylglycerol synthase transmembrane domain-containing protein [Luteolibacter sp.]
MIESSRRNLRIKAGIFFLLKLTLTGLGLWWAFSHVDWNHPVFTHPEAIDYSWLLAGVGTAGLGVILCAIRWWFFLKAQSLRVSIWRSIELTMIGNLFNLVSTAGIGGDAARILLLIRDHPGRKLVVAMAVMMDHLAGMVALALSFFVISAARFEALTEQSRLGRDIIHFSWVWFSGGLGLVALIFICASPPVHRKIHANNRFAKWPFMVQIPLIYDTYRRNWKLTLAGAAFSFALLAAYFASFWCGLRAVGGTTSLTTVVSAMPVIESISSMPVSVAGVGVRESTFQILLKDLANVSAETAVAASLAGFSCNTFWAFLGAFFFLKKRDRVSVAELEEVGKTETETVMSKS